MTTTTITNPEFQVVRLNEPGLAKANEIGERFNDLLEFVKSTIPEGRHLSIVKTTLEDACMHARKAIATVPKYVDGGKAIGATGGL